MGSGKWLLYYFDGHPEGEPENDDFIRFDLCAILDVLMHLEYFDRSEVARVQGWGGGD